jgi:hypothetical protein
MENVMKKIFILAASSVAFAGSAHAAETVSATTQAKTTVERDASGNYEKKQKVTAKSTDEAGTTTKSETKVDVEIDADGSGEKTVKHESVTDPKGLMNKTKTVTTDTIKQKDDGTVSTKHKKTVDGKIVEETTEDNKVNH